MREPRSEAALDETLRALAEPRRRAILQLVVDRELPAGEIAAHYAVTRSAVSQHLQLLKAAGLVRERRAGVRRLYRASPDGLRELRAYLDELWGESLEAARALVEAEAGWAGSAEDLSAADWAEPKHA
ncbi:MAG: winged helix-turn-helix transcriptional regulator [Chloroflexi bacterium]|nr:winged helix-turn-helix transcriptional regulator [Chloroflexota bacterium]MBF6606838.1 winged helix-turn-helix transcriptional regulator [Chloroflexota bacterium]